MTSSLGEKIKTPNWSQSSQFSTYKSFPMLQQSPINLMDHHLRHNPNPSGDIFAFPPISRDSELADQLFSNGKLLLHEFPNQPTNFTIPRSVIMSRTSSISSKGSLMSSRSNSTNSSISISSISSNCSSARTSTSEASTRRKLSTPNHARSVAVKSSNVGHRLADKEFHSRSYCNGYGHSQGWQFISPVPVTVMNRRSCSKRRRGRKGKVERDVRKGVCRRFFGWLVSTCQECHAIEPSKRLKVSM